MGDHPGHLHATFRVRRAELTDRHYVMIIEHWAQMLHWMIIGRYLRSPQIGQGELHLTHSGEDGWGGINSGARQSLIIVGVSRIPKRLATR